MASTSPDRPLEPFGTLELAQADLPRDGPLQVALRLAEPSADANPLPASVLSTPDERVWSAEARLDATRTIATIEIDAGWLQPGNYVVTLKTTERSPMPLRRYAIVVR
jgi:hypothetical protein